ncbi:hypothetical protein BCR44DRAFT_1425319 [Catenaria anguillulae PL171]|uniref:Uncharacterized protein n=1 Tax=Catenaria anguillulae PL171 TaxID=765915 RepID=A0A1Y2I145_9FUNG|nr:hypothetical protein BCR44DRAFT_1425319 [Catenaria anguillulae PL171]
MRYCWSIGCGWVARPAALEANAAVAGETGSGSAAVGLVVDWTEASKRLRNCLWVLQWAERYDGVLRASGIGSLVEHGSQFKRGLETSWDGGTARQSAVFALCSDDELRRV